MKHKTHSLIALSLIITLFYSHRASAQLSGGTITPPAYNVSSLPQGEGQSLLPPAANTPYNTNVNNSYKQRLDSLSTGPLALPYNDAVQNYIDIYTQRKAQMGKMLALGKYYLPVFEKVLISNNLPKELKYLPIIESNLNPQAVSRVGATGLWQFMYTTAKGYRLSIDAFTDERKDPVLASQAAAAYFRDSFNELGNWLLVIASYNCGTGAVRRAVAKAGTDDFWEVRRFLPRETQNYVPAFIAAVYVMNYYKKHNIEPAEATLPTRVDYVTVNNKVALGRLAQALNVSEELLCRLNPQCKLKVANATAQKPMHLVLPSGSPADMAAVYNILNNDGAAAPRAMLSVNMPKAPAAEYTATADGKLLVCTVRPGQTLQSLATMYSVTVQDLKVWNNLKGYSVVPQQQIKIYLPQGSTPAAPRI